MQLVSTLTGQNWAEKNRNAREDIIPAKWFQNVPSSRVSYVCDGELIKYGRAGGHSLEIRRCVKSYTEATGLQSMPNSSDVVLLVEECIFHYYIHTN